MSIHDGALLVPWRNVGHIKRLKPPKEYRPGMFKIERQADSELYEQSQNL
jgi:hypothetical protein